MHEMIRMILMSDGDACGTVAALSQKINEFAADGKYLLFYIGMEC